MITFRSTIVFFIAMLVAGSSAMAFDLYSVSASAKRADGVAQVTLNPAVFDATRFSGGTSINLPDPSGAPQAARVFRTEAENADRFAVHGELDGAPGHFVITVRDGACAMSVIGDAGSNYHLKGSPDGYVVEVMDPAAESCGVDNLPQMFARAGKPPADAPAAKGGSPVMIDVMVVYTPAARVQAGGTANIEAEIQNAANLANGAYVNSGIDLVLTVVHMAEVTYSEESSLAISLAKLTFNNDGTMDDVHTLRNTYDADMVSLITRGGDVCGIGWIIENLEPSIAQQTFSVTNYYCLGGYTFAHELGHNMGCAHDQQNLTAEGYRLFSYSRGWRYNAADDGLLYRTVMAYPPGVRIPHFSNPGITYKGTPTGVPLGDPDEANNALTINTSMAQIALNRPLAAEGEGEGEVVYEGYYCELLGGLYNNTLLRNLLPDFADALFDLLDPAIADVNGGADPDTLTILGNGMLDCGHELGVLRRVYENTAYDASATGGITHAMVAGALANNRAQLEDDLGETNVAVVEGLAPGLLDLAVAYMTLGDDDSVGFIQALFDVINEIQFIGTLSLPQYTRLEAFLSAEGDADGDGFTNRAEYDAYASFGADIYVNFALDPGVYPGGEGEGEGEGEGPGTPVITGPGMVEYGDDVTLTAQATGLVGAVTYQWTKDGETILDSGEPTLFLPAVTEAAEGYYQVTITDQSKAVYVSEPFFLDVVIVLPMANVAAVVAVVLLMASVLLIRRSRAGARR